MNIAYSCNEAYIQHTGISMISLFENNKEVKEINIYFVSKDVCHQSLEILKKICVNYNRNLIIIPFESICYDLKLKDTGRHIETIYSKLFFERINNIDKIFYLDSDTIVTGSLEELWDVNLEGYFVAGVETYTVGVKKDLNLLESDIFINDGIVLMNLKEIRSANLVEEFLNFINYFEGAPPLLSEGTINVVCKNKIKILDPKYNLMSGFILYENDSRYYKSSLLGDFYTKEMIINAVASPIVIHYLDAFYNRPWSRYCTHPLKHQYLYYKTLSPWKNEKLTNRKLSKKMRITGFIIQKLPYEIFSFLKKLL